jgi:hypothetical protein
MRSRLAYRLAATPRRDRVVLGRRARGIAIGKENSRKKKEDEKYPA